MTNIIVIMEELVTITMVTVTMTFYRQNSMDSKKENRKKKKTELTY